MADVCENNRRFVLHIFTVTAFETGEIHENSVSVARQGFDESKLHYYKRLTNYNIDSTAKNCG